MRCVGKPLIGGMLAWAVFAAFAEEDAGQLLAASPEALMTMTVSLAAATPQPLARAPAVVSALSADDLAATGATDLMEALLSVPGLYVRRNLFGYKPLLSMRGASGANVLLLIDGAPAKDLVWSPSIFWKGMPANRIERIEVLRGPASALYGADAAAGVINVVTRAAAVEAGDEQGEAGGRLGHYGRRDLWWRKSGGLGDLTYALTVDLQQNDGHRPEILRDRLGEGPARAAYGWQGIDVQFSLSGKHHRFLFEHVSRHDVAIGLTGAAVLDDKTRARERQTSWAWLYENPSLVPDWGASGEIRYRDLAYDSGNGFWERLPAVTLNRLATAERRFNAEGSLLYKGVPNHAFRLGGGVSWQTPYDVRQTWDGIEKRFIPETTRRNVYAFLQDIWKPAANWELTLGVRHDRYSDFGAVANPRLAIVWQAQPFLALKLMAGSAYRAPSYLELYSQTAATKPNPGLRPEKSRTHELALAWQAGSRFAVEANVYRFERRDVIADLAGRFANLPGSHTTRGFELEARWQPLTGLRLVGHHSHFWQEEALRDVNVPRRQAYLRLDWDVAPKWHWNIQARRLAARPLPSGDPRRPIGANTIVDTTIRYFYGAEWEFAASLRNAFDAALSDYTSQALPDNLPGPGRSAWIEARFKF